MLHIKIRFCNCTFFLSSDFTDTIFFLDLSRYYFPLAKMQVFRFEKLGDNQVPVSFLLAVELYKISDLAIFIHSYHHFST